LPRKSRENIGHLQAEAGWILTNERLYKTDGVMKKMMSFVVGIAIPAFIMAWSMASSAVAQTAEPTYKADPDVYKVIFEDANYRVIEANRKKGVRDKGHGHPVASVVYYVTDCKTKAYATDGKTTETSFKAGTARANPVIASHSAENTGTADCKTIFVEKK
jgi:hypothetical protein